MGTFVAAITAKHGSTIAVPTVTSFKVRGKAIIGLLLDIPQGMQGSPYGNITTGFQLIIDTETIWPTAGQWIILDNFHAYVPFRYKLDKYEKDATINAYTTDNSNDHTGELVVVTEDNND
jgi:hypothetical protein